MRISNVQGFFRPFGHKISLSERIVEIKLNSNTINSRSGTICSLSDDICIDQEEGYTSWNPIPIDNCKYANIANKMVNYDHNDF